MIRDLGKEFFQQAHAPMYDTLESDSKKPLYSGCKKSLTLLSAMLSLVNVKAKYGWSDKSFTYCVRWVWSIRKYMHALMNVYCTNMGMNKCINSPGVGYHGTKWRMTTSVTVTKAQRKAPPSKGVMVYSDHSKVWASVC